MPVLSKQLPTAEELRQLFNYDPCLGQLTWRTRTAQSVRIGGQVGTRMRDGYVRVRLPGRQRCLAHRIIWCWMTGEWPKRLIDHRDGDPSNNRWDNLREATPMQNQGNSKKPITNTSGLKGASYFKPNRKWRASIHDGNRMKHLGYFLSAEEAHAAYVDAARQRFGEFARP